MPPRSAAKGKAPAGGADRPPPVPMEVDPAPAPPRAAHPAAEEEDEVVAEYELVLCEPVGPGTEVSNKGVEREARGDRSAIAKTPAPTPSRPSASASLTPAPARLFFQVCVMSFPLVSTARASRSGPDPGVAARCLAPLAARMKPRARRFEADVAAVGVPVPDTGTDDEGEDGEDDDVACTTTTSSSSSSEDDDDGASTTSSDGGPRANGRGRGRGRVKAAAAANGAAAAPPPRTVTLAGLLTPTGGRKVLAALRGGRLLLAPAHSSLALLPCLGGREGSGLGGGPGATSSPPSAAAAAKAEADGRPVPPPPPQPLTPVTVRVNRRETERQVEAREASYAHLAELEAREAWVPVRAAAPPLRPGEGGRPAG